MSLAAGSRLGTHEVTDPSVAKGAGRSRPAEDDTRSGTRGAG
jgi:hypothetical protein